MLDVVFAKAVLPKTGVLIVPVAEGAALSGLAGGLDAACGGLLARAIKAGEFSGKKGQKVDLLGPVAGIKRVLVMGTGKAEDFTPRAAEEFGGAVEMYFGPNRTVRELHEMIKAGELDPLREFSEIAREELWRDAD